MATKRRFWGANLKFDLEAKATVLSLLSYIFTMLNSHRLRLYKFCLFPVSEPCNPLSWWTTIQLSACQVSMLCTANWPREPRLYAWYDIGLIVWRHQLSHLHILPIFQTFKISPELMQIFANRKRRFHFFMELYCTWYVQK